MRSDSGKPLLVGEDNPYGADPRYALYMEPENSAGGRLCRVILGLSGREYLRRFDRVNLCSGKWSMVKARAAAFELLRAGNLRPIILLGRKVATAFGFQYDPVFTRIDRPGRAFFLLPHPSGRCRVWDTDPEAVAKARGLLAQFLPGWRL